MVIVVVIVLVAALVVAALMCLLCICVPGSIIFQLCQEARGARDEVRTTWGNGDGDIGQPMVRFPAKMRELPWRRDSPLVAWFDGVRVGW